MIDRVFPARGGKWSVKARAWEPPPAPPALDPHAVAFEGLRWAKSSARRRTAQSCQTHATLPGALVTHTSALLWSGKHLLSAFCAHSRAREGIREQKGAGAKKRQNKKK